MHKELLIISEVCQAVSSLKRADVIAIDINPQFSALESRIQELEEWLSLRVSEIDEELEKEGVEILDNFKIECRPYA